ncbi:glycosyltransferase 87 family protein [Georgenia ruanii]|uniref:DUF2029 domain-containing protein n=1 Tax=Georgenia ruanii TaxID=348442 RepID=A0A7J9UTC0_9MICO|nr:glycosyltransferase 87 family protein [Georgenia ruanii]MPV87859.1 DUF2029 domain-containing protein [Georgenia ruanii]
MTGPDPGSGPPTRSRRRDLVPVAAPVAAVAAAVRLLPVLAGGGLRGAGGYDDGVYFTAATALVHGRVPYADFVLLHPPGITLVLAPFAALTWWVPDSVAFAVARVAFVALGALTAVLVARLGEPAGRAAALTAGLAYALAPAAAYAERTTMLEGPANLCLAGALVVLLARPLPTARAALGAGALLGLGAGVKVWGVVPLAVVAGWVALHGGRRRLAQLLTGAAAALTAVCLPFFLAAPGEMVRYVVLAQLGRARMAAGWTDRLAGVVGPALGPAAAPRPAEVALVAAGCVVVGLAAWSLRRDRRARLFLALAGAAVLTLLASPTTFRHYGALAAVPVSVVLGLAVQRARDGPVRHRRAAQALVAGGAAVLVTAAVVSLGPANAPFPRVLADAARRVDGCVTADDPTALVLMDTLARDLTRGCRVWVDVSGLTYDPARPGHGTPRSRDQRWQREVLGYLASGAATLVHRPATGLGAASRATVATWPVLAEADGFRLRAPRP